MTALRRQATQPKRVVSVGRLTPEDRKLLAEIDAALERRDSVVSIEPATLHRVVPGIYAKQPKRVADEPIMSRTQLIICLLFAAAIGAMLGMGSL